MNNRWIKTVITALLLLSLLTGCGSFGTKNSSGRETAPMAVDMAETAAAGKSAYAPQNSNFYTESYSDGGYWEAEPMEAPSSMAGGGASGAAMGENNRADTYDKIIYSGSANVETIRFDETIEQIYQMIERFNGFLESSYITGRDYNSQYYDRYSYRNAEFVIRVPRECFSDLRGSLDELGSVTYASVEAQNITSAYRDTESRLAAYRVEESRLLEMLKKAEYVEDMLNIEDRLSNVRYQIESLTTALTNWDSKVNYSTMRLSVQEVKELTVEKPIARTFGEDIRDAVQGSLEWLAEAGKDIVLFVTSALPLLVIPAVLVLIVILVIRSQRRKKRKNAALQQTKDVKDDD